MKLVKYIFSFAMVVFIANALANTQVTGAGSSFIYPILAQWGQVYNSHTGIEINYQPIGSGGGVRAIEAKTVAFAATDEPLSLAQLKQYNLSQAPMIVGGIVPIVNLPGINSDELLLDGKTLADIYLGTVKKWNDPEIKKLNPTLNLPDSMIVAVHRSDGSGTTFNFTQYLSMVSSDWNKKVGSNSVVSWPGFGLGAKGNAGVASQVKNIHNSIGYVEYAYATQNNLVTTRLKNRDGRDVKASGVTFAAAAESAKWNPANGFALSLTNQHGVMSWPIVVTTFVLIPRQPRSTDERDAALKFLTWSYQNGKNMAQNLNYVAIPPAVYKKVLADWKTTFKTQ